MRILVCFLVVGLLIGCTEKIEERDLNIVTTADTQEQIQRALMDAKEENESTLFEDIKWLMSQKSAQQLVGYRGTLRDLIKTEASSASTRQIFRLAQLKTSQAEYEKRSKIVNELPIKISNMHLKKGRVFSKKVWYGSVNIKNNAPFELSKVKYLMRVSSNGEVLAVTEYDGHVNRGNSWNLSPTLPVNETREIHFKLDDFGFANDRFYTPKILNAQDRLFEAFVIDICDDNNQCLMIGQSDVSGIIQSLEKALQKTEEVLGRYTVS